MDAKELIKKVRKIEIKTKGLSSQMFSGEYHSAFKGRGMAFSEVREYAPGDEIRTIDWNVTARFNDPYVKVFEEERELTVMLLVDLSQSSDFGTNQQLKREVITELCAVLSFAAINNNDKAGMILFTDKVEKFIPPKKGRSHILRMIRELLEFETESKGTNIGEAVSYFTRMIKKRSIAFVISDFQDVGYQDSLLLARRRHDLVSLMIEDQREGELPNVGWVKMVDPETGEEAWINTSSQKERHAFEKSHYTFKQDTLEFFKKSGIDACNIRTGQDYIKPLLNLFKQR